MLVSASYPWLKLFIKAAEDTKLRTLTDNAHRVWYQLLCLAGDGEDRGKADLSHRRLAENQIGKSWEEIESALEEFTALGLIEIESIGDVENAQISIVNWEKYQGDKVREDTKKRVAKSRAKNKKTPTPTSCNTDVTQVKQECNTDVTQQKIEVRSKSIDKEQPCAREEIENLKIAVSPLVHTFLIEMGWNSHPKVASNFIEAIVEAIPDSRVLSPSKLSAYLNEHKSREQSKRIRSPLTLGKLLVEDAALFTEPIPEPPPPPCTNPDCENGLVFDENVAYPCPNCKPKSNTKEKK